MKNKINKLLILFTLMAFQSNVFSQERIVRNYQNIEIKYKETDEKFVKKGLNTFIFEFRNDMIFEIYHIDENTEMKEYLRATPMSESKDNDGNEKVYFLINGEDIISSLLIIYKDYEYGVRLITKNLKGEGIDFHFF